MNAFDFYETVANMRVLFRESYGNGRETSYVKSESKRVSFSFL